jgi:hypothetical protein
MNISPVKLFSFNAPSCKNPTQLKSQNSLLFAGGTGKAIDGKSLLAQMPYIYFGKIDYNAESLDISDEYRGPQSPDVEINKFAIAKQVDKDIQNENYLAAIEGKIELARICKNQGKDKDAYRLEESVRRLYKGLPKYQKKDALETIADYNEDMAKYIEKDIY